MYDYFPNGKLYRSVEYHSDIQGIQSIGKTSSFLSNENIQSVYDSTGNQTVKEGNGHYQIFNPTYKTIEEEGEVKDGKRNGTWKGSLNKGEISYNEEYVGGKFIKGASTNESGITINYTVKEALPTFRGGESAFGRYLSESIRYPPRARNKGIQGRVTLSFVIERDGSLTDIKILKSVYPELDAEAVSVISQSPKWNPGLQHGVPVRVAYTMPINFNLGR